MLTQREQPLLATIGARLDDGVLKLDLGGLQELTLGAADFTEPVEADVWGRRVPGRAASADTMRAAREYLEPGGALVVEHGYDQADALQTRFAAAGFEKITLVRDLGKNPRVTYGFA